MTVIRRDTTECSKRPRSRIAQFLVALPPVFDLLLSAKHLFVAAIVAIASVGGVKGCLLQPRISGQDLASVRRKQAFPPRYRASKVPFLDVRTAPEPIAELEERLSLQKV